MQDNQISGGEQGVKRRTLVKGAAWAAPVVTFAAAAPMAAASPPPVAPSVGDDSCKHTKGVKRYHIELEFSNSLNCATDVHIVSFVVDPNSGSDVSFTSPAVDTDFTIPAKGSLSWEYDSDEVGNIANGEVDITYTYTDCQGNVVAERVSINVSSLEPCTFDYPHTSTP
ncbi:hypothetical protein [Janibacter sp. G56]|uniref:hypothetical protein n=1 Tax=Janibacter sp. G56 TaxID=3418717 RepID=UPI003CFE05FC